MSTTTSTLTSASPPTTAPVNGSSSQSPHPLLENNDEKNRFVGLILATVLHQMSNCHAIVWWSRWGWLVIHKSARQVLWWSTLRVALMRIISRRWVSQWQLISLFSNLIAYQALILWKKPSLFGERPSPFQSGISAVRESSWICYRWCAMTLLQSSSCLICRENQH